MSSGEVLKGILKQKGIRQSFLVEKLNIPKTTLSTRLAKEIRFEFLIEVCNLIDLSLFDYFCIFQNENKERRA